MNNIKKKYHLTPVEFSVILAGHGVSRMFGLDTIDGQINNKDIVVALHSMFKNQLIENVDDKGFSTDAELAEIINAIKLAKKQIVFKYSIGNSKRNTCCHVFEKLAVAEENSLNSDKISIYEASVDEFVDEIFEENMDSDIEATLYDAKGGMKLKSEYIENDLPKNEKKQRIIRICREAML